MYEKHYYSQKIEDFKPLEPGTILKYLGHHYQHDYQNYLVAYEVIGIPPHGADIPNVQFVDTSVINLENYT